MEIIQSKNGTIIYPYNKGDCKILEKLTSSWDKVYHKSNEVTGFVMSPYNGKQCFVTHHFKPAYLEALLPDVDITKIGQTRNLLMSEKISLNNDIELTELQGFVSLDILNSVNKYKEWFINMPTGSGKTVTGVYISSVFNTKTMITCYSTEILKQWVKTYEDMTDIDHKKIVRITSSTMKKILKPTFDPDEYDVYLCTPNILMNIMKNNDLTFFNKLMSKLGIGLLINDEAHRHMKATVKIGALSNIKYTIHASADFGQGNYELENKFYNIFNNTKIIKIPEKFKPSFKYTTAIVYSYDSQPNNLEKLSIYDRYGFSSEKYMDYQIRKKVIYDVVREIVDSIGKANPNGYKTLILIPNIAHIKAMSVYLHKKFKNKKIVEYYQDVGYDTKSDIISESDIIISTYKSFSTGIDVKDIKYIIGLNQSNKVEDNQSAGRSRPLSDGTNAVYFMVVDRGFAYCTTKLSTRLRYLKDQKLATDPYIHHYTKNLRLKI